MKYSELFTKGNGIFATVFKTEYPTEYSAIFGDTDPTKLDAYALLMYGGKTVVSSITSDKRKRCCFGGDCGKRARLGT